MSEIIFKKRSLNLTRQWVTVDLKLTEGDDVTQISSQDNETCSAGGTNFGNSSPVGTRKTNFLPKAEKSLQSEFSIFQRTTSHQRITFLNS